MPSRLNQNFLEKGFEKAYSPTDLATLLDLKHYWSGILRFLPAAWQPPPTVS